MIRSACEQILGYEVFALRVDDCVTEIANSVQNSDEAHWLACLNPHAYATARKRPAYAAALRNANWLVPDGAGIVLASKALGGEIHDRVTGSDVFVSLHNELQSRGGASVYFLGSTEKTLMQIRHKMGEDWPAIDVVGTYSPPFKATFSATDLEEMIAEINQAKPDVLWVGMTAPKQEEFIASVIDRLDVRFAGAIGAVFDFYIGSIRRSDPIFQRLGLEWLPRLLQEPRRLWRRTFVSAPIFVWHVIKMRFGIMPP